VAATVHVFEYYQDVAAAVVADEDWGDTLVAVVAREA
jgi:hypothetical protein